MFFVALKCSSRVIVDFLFFGLGGLGSSRRCSVVLYCFSVLGIVLLSDLRGFLVSVFVVQGIVASLEGFSCRRCFLVCGMWFLLVVFRVRCP